VHICSQIVQAHAGAYLCDIEPEGWYSILRAIAFDYDATHEIDPLSGYLDEMRPPLKPAIRNRHRYPP